MNATRKTASAKRGSSKKRSSTSGRRRSKSSGRVAYQTDVSLGKRYRYDNEDMANEIDIAGTTHFYEGEEDGEEYDNDAQSIDIKPTGHHFGKRKEPAYQEVRGRLKKSSKRRIRSDSAKDTSTGRRPNSTHSRRSKRSTRSGVSAHSRSRSCSTKKSLHSEKGRQSKRSVTEQNL